LLALVGVAARLALDVAADTHPTIPLLPNLRLVNFDMTGSPDSDGDDDGDEDDDPLPNGGVVDVRCLVIEGDNDGGVFDFVGVALLVIFIDDGVNGCANKLFGDDDGTDDRVAFVTAGDINDMARAGEANDMAGVANMLTNRLLPVDADVGVDVGVNDDDRTSEDDDNDGRDNPTVLGFVHDGVLLTVLVVVLVVDVSSSSSSSSPPNRSFIS
jgi:hypothetical protein